MAGGGDLRIVLVGREALDRQAARVLALAARARRAAARLRAEAAQARAAAQAARRA